MMRGESKKGNVADAQRGDGQRGDGQCGRWAMWQMDDVADPGLSRIHSIAARTFIFLDNSRAYLSALPAWTS